MTIRDKHYGYFFTSVIAAVLTISMIAIFSAVTVYAASVPQGNGAGLDSAVAIDSLEVPQQAAMAAAATTTAPLEADKGWSEIPVSVTENNSSTGAATHRLTIDIPPGRLGGRPDISLIYNSNNRNGWLGVGWSLDIGSIQRSAKWGLSYSANDYVFVVNGTSTELVSRSDWGSNYYGARIEDGKFTKYYKNTATDGWEVTAKDGTKYYYGKTPHDVSIDSRQTNTKGTFKWCLTWIQDTNGNYTKITYAKDQGEIYLDRIDYTGNGSLLPSNYVKFNREVRPDPLYRNNTFVAVTTAYRLESIEVYGNALLASKYLLDYGVGASTERSLLSTITRIGSDGISQLLPINAAWQNGIKGFDTDINAGKRTKGYSSDSYGYRMADVNGDGLTDFIYDNDKDLRVLLSTGQGFLDDDVVTNPNVIWGRRSVHYNNDFGFQMTDVNGDGRADLIYEDGSRNYRVILSNGSRFLPETVWGIRTQGYISSSPTFRMADVNGDGLPDIVYDSDNGGSYIRVLLNTGSGFQTDANWGKRQKGYNASAGSFQMVDMNGDGLADFIYQNGSDVHVLLSTGIGFRSDDATAIWGKQTSGYSSATPGFRMADVNGDGLPDFVYEAGSSGNIKILVNTGTGFQTDTLWGQRKKSYNSADFGFQMADVNGDGMADFVYDHDRQIRVLLSAGNGFKIDDDTAILGARLTSYNNGNKNFAVADVNGDGLADLVYDSDSNGSYLRLIPGKGPYPDLISVIRNELGAAFSVNYAPSSEYSNARLPFIAQTVSSITVDDGISAPATTQYTYHDGYYDFAEREFRGFGYVKQIRPDLSTNETWYHQRDAGPWYWDGSGWVNWRNCFETVADDKDYKGRPCHTEIREPWPNDATIGVLLSEADYAWGSDKPQGIYPMFAKLLSKSSIEYPGGAAVQRDEANTYDDTNGNLLSTTVSGMDAEKVVTATQYQNLGTWLWRPVEATVTGVADNGYAGSGLRRKTKFEYYGNSTGNLWKKKSYLEGIPETAWPTETMTYTTEGNLATKQDANLNTTTYTTYDTTKTFPTRIDYPTTNSVTHFEEATYNYRFGKPATKKDENLNTTVYSYDPFGRSNQVDAPDGGQTATFYYDSASPVYSLTRVKETASGQPIDKYQYFDGLGRSRETITIGEGGKSIVSRSRYNSMGRVDLTEGPFFGPGTGYGYTQLAPAEYPKTETTYNYFGKPVSIQSADGQYGTVISDISYSGLSTTYYEPRASIDPNNIALKTETKDYLGTLKKVTEYADEGQQFTNYAYNAAGDLLTVTDHNGNVTTVNYDTLGRKINMNDPDMGYWIYTYDANGNLKTQTDARNQIITFNYDELNRATSKIYSTGDPTVNYTYDNLSIPNGRGRLYSVSNTLATTTFTAYDAMGRTRRTTKTIQGDPTQYVTETAYDLSGKTTTITYPDGYMVTNTYYPGTGLLYQVTGSDSVIYSTNSLYEPTGKMGQIDHPNGTSTSYRYDAKSTRLTGILTTSPASAGDPRNDVINKSYVYTPAGDLAIITDYKKGAAMGLPNNVFDYEYQYDKLHRLKTEQFKDSAEAVIPASFPPVSYTYDPIGNIASKVSGPTTLGYTYHPTKKHAVSIISVNGTPYAFDYDDNGNMINGYDLTNPGSIVSRSLTWNADNMPTVVTRNGISTTLSYDGEGTRVKKVGSSGTTYYIGEHFEVSNNDPTKYIFAGNLRIAKVGAASGTYYFHKDHLGSSSAMTTILGSVQEEMNSMPFGEQREHTGLTLSNYKFTDKEFDGDTSLYYYGARYYDPVVSMWGSPDPALLKYFPDSNNPKKDLPGGGGVFNPRNLGLYSYAHSNPLIKIDPDGKVTLIVHGTWGAHADWVQTEDIFNQSVSRSFHERAVPFTWSGENSVIARTHGAQMLFELIRTLKDINSNVPINLIAHSHGANVVKEYTQIPAAPKIDTFIALGAPQRDDYIINLQKVDKYINVYSDDDSVQTMGGYIQKWSRKYEVGPAGRLDPIAPYNFNVSEVLNNIGHSDLHTAPVWEAIDMRFLAQ